MELVCARWLEAVGFVTIKSAERRAPSAERRLLLRLHHTAIAA